MNLKFQIGLTIKTATEIIGAHITIFDFNHVTTRVKEARVTTRVWVNQDQARQTGGEVFP